MKKVRKINNCLVAGAGRLSSVIAFFEWFEKWSDAQVVQGEAPHVTVFVPEGINDEDFHGLVIFSDRVIFFYEGGKTSYSLENQEYVAIGSGADYAIAAMDAGLSAEEAVKIAIGRDVFSGGEVFVETLDPEPEEITRESAEKMTQAELLDLLFGKIEEPFEPEPLMIWDSESVSLDLDGNVLLKCEVRGKKIIFNYSVKENPYSPGIAAEYKTFINSVTKDTLNTLILSIGGQGSSAEETKSDLFEFIISDLTEMYKTK